MRNYGYYTEILMLCLLYAFIQNLASNDTLVSHGDCFCIKPNLNKNNLLRIEMLYKNHVFPRPLQFHAEFCTHLIPTCFIDGLFESRKRFFA